MRRPTFVNPFDALYDQGHVADSELRKNLNLIVLAAALGVVFFGNINGAPMTGLSTAFGANDFVFGLLWALPVLMSVAQMYASRLIERTGKNRTIFIAAGIIQRSIWILVALLPYIIPDKLAGSRIWAMVVIVSISSLASTFMNAGFYSFFADMVPGRIRGRYISMRSRICTIFSMAAGLTFALILDTIPGFPGYTLVFLIASVFGVADIVTFFFIKTPPFKRSPQAGSIIGGIKRVIKTPELRNYIVFWGVWSFSVNISAPFFTKYALDVQGLSFMQIMLAGQITANVMTILLLPFWGRLLDEYGAKPILFVTSTIAALIIFVWMPAKPGMLLPILLFNGIGGMVWCGNDIVSQNMLLSHTPEEGRSMVTAVYFVVNSLMSAAAFTIGGAFLEGLKPFFAAAKISLMGVPFDQYKALFLVAIVARLVPVIFLLPRVKSEIPAEHSAVAKVLVRHAVNLSRLAKSHIRRRS